MSYADTCQTIFSTYTLPLNRLTTNYKSDLICAHECHSTVYMLSVYMVLIIYIAYLAMRIKLIILLVLIITEHSL